MPLPNRKGHGGGSKVSSKQANLKMEEMKQLESFLKTRGAEVDQEIAALKGKLKVHNITLSTKKQPIYNINSQYIHTTYYISRNKDTIVYK